MREVRAEDYIVRPEHALVRAPDPEMVAWMQSQPEFTQLRIRARGAHPRAYAWLCAVTQAGQEWVSSACGTQGASEAEQVPGWKQWVTSSEAADLLGVQPRAVRQAIARGRLKAELQDGRHRIRRDDLEHYRATRQEKAA